MLVPIMFHYLENTDRKEKTDQCKCMQKQLKNMSAVKPGVA
jgi:hypothetical protein